MVNKTTYSEEEIIAKVKEFVGEIVMIDPSDISVNASLLDDLGMESIDLMDLVFRLEKTFGILLPRKNPIQNIAAQFTRDKFVKDGKLTGNGIKILRRLFPEHDQSRIYEGMTDDEIPSLITVQSYVNIAKRALELKEWQPEKCDQCGSKEFIPQDKEKLEFPDGEIPQGPVFLCKSCDNLLIAPSFDDEIYKQLEGAEK